MLSGNNLNVIELRNINRLENIEIVHVVDFPCSVKFSILKIIENLQKNIKARQIIMSSSNIKYCFISEAIRRINPKLVHLHSNSEGIVRALRKSIPLFPVIQTVHGDVKSKLEGLAELIICIHEPAFIKNKQFNAMIIENSVDVNPSATEKTENFHSFLTLCRICPYYLTHNCIEVFKRINEPFFIYGQLYRSKGHFDEIQDSLKNSKVTINKWSNNILDPMALHSVYAFHQSEKFPDLCYGLSVMEAARYGMPIIAVKRQQQFQQYVVDGLNGFIVDDSDDFVKMTKTVSQSSEIFSMLCRNAFHHSKTLVNDMPMKYEEVYRKYI